MMAQRCEPAWNAEPQLSRNEQHQFGIATRIVGGRSMAEWLLYASGMISIGLTFACFIVAQ
jgi:hypothetical protein